MLHNLMCFSPIGRGSEELVHSTSQLENLVFSITAYTKPQLPLIPH